MEVLFIILGVVGIALTYLLGRKKLDVVKASLYKQINDANDANKVLVADIANLKALLTKAESKTNEALTAIKRRNKDYDSLASDFETAIATHKKELTAKKSEITRLKKRISELDGSGDAKEVPQEEKPAKPATKPRKTRRRSSSKK